MQPKKKEREVFFIDYKSIASADANRNFRCSRKGRSEVYTNH